MYVKINAYIFLIKSAFFGDYSKAGEPISSMKKLSRVVSFRLRNFTALKVFDYIFKYVCGNQRLDILIKSAFFRG